MPGAINTWILSDGRAGHVNQVRGLIQLLEKHGMSLQVQKVPCRPRFKLANRLSAWALNNSNAFLPLPLFHGLYQITHPANKIPDLIVSAGGDTAGPNAALARQFGIPNLFVGSRRHLQARHFSAYLTLEPQGGDSNIVMALPPSMITPETTQAPAQALRNDLPNPMMERRLWTLLIGGNGAGFTYTEDDWDSLAHAINLHAQQQGIRWLLSTSRRTGLKTEHYLQTRIQPESLADAVWYNQAPRKIMPAYLGAAEHIFCTADSMSMIADGLNAGKPVISLWPRQASPDTQYAQALASLENALPLRRLTLAELENRTLPTPAQSLEDNIQSTRINAIHAALFDALLQKIKNHRDQTEKL